MESLGVVKLQKEREKSEKDRKKWKKSKSKSDEKKHESKKRHREDSTKSTHKKLTTDEDRSSVTEERGCPASTGLPLYDSSDVSQDNNKRILFTSVPIAEEQELKKTINSSVSEPQGEYCFFSFFLYLFLSSPFPSLSPLSDLSIIFFRK